MEIEKIADITSRLIVNRAALKTRPTDLDALDRQVPGGGACRIGSIQRSQADFEARDFETTSSASKREMEEDVDATVAANPGGCPKARGNAAVVDYTNRFDRVGLYSEGEPRPLEGARSMPTKRRNARRTDGGGAAMSRRRGSRSYHARMLPESFSYYTDADGRCELGARWSADLGAAGLYVPGGTCGLSQFRPDERACRPRSPASKRLVMVVPTPDGVINPLVMAAAQLAGVRRGLPHRRRPGGRPRWPMGRRRSAPSTRSSGPATPIVAAAKRRVFGTVGIDMIAGPSEILVVADARERSRLDRRRPAVPGRTRYRPPNRS